MGFLNTATTRRAVISRVLFLCRPLSQALDMCSRQPWEAGVSTCPRSPGCNISTPQQAGGSTQAPVPRHPSWPRGPEDVQEETLPQTRKAHFPWSEGEDRGDDGCGRGPRGSVGKEHPLFHCQRRGTPRPLWVHCVTARSLLLSACRCPTHTSQAGEERTFWCSQGEFPLEIATIGESVKGF